MTASQKERICNILILPSSTSDEDVLYLFIEYVIEYFEKKTGVKVNNLKSQNLRNGALTQEEKNALALKLGIDPNNFGLKSQPMTFYT